MEARAPSLSVRAAAGRIGDPAARLLIVDDEPHVCEIMSRWLDAEGYNCHTANSAEEAWGVIKRNDLALVIHELATNVIKYALGERNTAQITFQVAFDGGMVRCEFRDDGPGYSEDVLQLERYNVGFDLIQNIVRDSLHGELALHNDDGAVAIFQFKTRITQHAIRNTQRRDPR